MTSPRHGVPANMETEKLVRVNPDLILLKTVMSGRKATKEQIQQKNDNNVIFPYQLPDAPPPPDDPPPPEKPDPPDDQDVPELPELTDKPPIEARPLVSRSF